MGGTFFFCILSYLDERCFHIEQKCRIVGMAGIGESLVLVAFCGLCTFLTSISLSAIATNGAMKVHFLG